MSQPDRTARMLELDNAFHRKSFELCGMEAHYDHMLASLQHVERIRKFSLQTEENKSVCSTAHGNPGSTAARQPGRRERSAGKPPEPV